MRTSPPRTKLQVEADRRAIDGLRRLGAEIRQLREDAGLSKAIVARVAGIDPALLRGVERGEYEASSITLARIAAALGAEASTRLFPSAGPPIRDRFQARMIEAFLRHLPADWYRSPEVPVHRPVRGVVDLVIAHRPSNLVACLEAHSELRRLEQQIRWALAKAEALRSSPIWPFLAPDPADPPPISSVLLLRSTTATRDLARTFRDTLRAAFPADPASIHAALADPTQTWPGNGILWVRVDGSEATLLPSWPRGLP
jgi:transcriptional regulator with XRE-family HTH domain